MAREDELREALPKDKRVYMEELVKQVAYLEDELEKLSKLPHIAYQEDRSVQKVLPAGKAYKEKLNLYLNSIKTLLSATKTQQEEDDLLAQMVKEFGGDD